jgi:pimeloyl-ACP methyl ester carboxylesterase
MSGRHTSNPSTARRLRQLPTACLLLLSCLTAWCSSQPEAFRPARLEEAPLLFATVDGHRVAYRAAGRGGPTLVFVHGWTCDMTSWKYQFPAFAKTHRVIALDLPGHGASDKPDVTYSMDLFARAVDAVLTADGSKRAVLVGHSMGTMVVRQFYRLHKDKTAALVVVDGALRPFTLDPAAVDKFLSPYRGSDADARKAQAAFVDAMVPEKEGELRQELKRVVLSTPRNVVVSAGQAMFDPAIWKDDNIWIPVLAVYAKSPFWSEEYETFVHKMAPLVNYKVFEGVGHFLMLEKPELFNAALSAFLADLPRR